MSEETKPCPYCGETIPIDTIECPHCNEKLKNIQLQKVGATVGIGMLGILTGVIKFISGIFKFVGKILSIHFISLVITVLMVFKGFGMIFASEMDVAEGAAYAAIWMCAVFFLLLWKFTENKKGEDNGTRN